VRAALLRRALAAALLVAAGGPASGRDDENPAEPPRAPINAAEKAEAGDWCALRVTLNERGLVSASTTVLEVAAVESDAVSVRSASGEVKVLSKKTAPTLAEAIGLPRRGKLAGVKVTDEKHAAGGKEFACKRVAFEVRGGDPYAGAAWFSEDVKVTGLVAMKTKGTGEGNSGLSIELELLGYGTRDRTIWGERPAPETKKPAK
jgi:hypothetical protein